MAEETISTAILTVATIIAAIVLLNAIYPTLYTATGSILSMNGVATDRIKTDMKVITEYPRADVNGYFALTTWVKNTGSSTITAAEMGESDMYLYPGGGVSVRIPPGSTGKSWYSNVKGGDGDADWDPGETLEIELNYGEALTPGVMKLRIALHNGIYAEDTFSW